MTLRPSDVGHPRRTLAAASVAAFARPRGGEGVLPLPVLVLLCLLSLAAASCTRTGEPDLPRMRPLTSRVFERTAVRAKRGKYLTEGVCQCFLCHSERDWGAPGAPIIAATKGGGRIISEDSARLIVAPNISPDPETGAGAWTDDMLARAIREGIGHDGRALAMPMWYWAFANLSDEDLASVVVYLRTISPVRNPLPKRRLPPEAEREALDGPAPITEPVPARKMQDPVARGRYLAEIADCSGCHSAWEAPFVPGVFGGGNLVEAISWRRKGNGSAPTSSARISPPIRRGSRTTPIRCSLRRCAPAPSARVALTA